MSGIGKSPWLKSLGPNRVSLRNAESHSIAWPAFVVSLVGALLAHEHGVLLLAYLPLVALLTYPKVFLMHSTTR